MLYVILAEDRPGHLETRLATRAVHLDYLSALGEQLVLAGPFLGEDGNPVGSMVVVEAADAAAARAMADADPYAKAGLFASVAIRPWRWAVKNRDGR